MTIDLGMPPKACWPNARPHFMARARAVKSYRLEARIEAESQLKLTKPRWTKARAVVTWYAKSNRRRDYGTNGIAALKAVWDGLVDAGLLKDDQHLTVEPAGVVVDRGIMRESVKITIEGTR